MSSNYLQQTTPQFGVAVRAESVTIDGNFNRPLGSVTQGTSATTNVTLDAEAGSISCFTSTLAANAGSSFDCANSAVVTGDLVTATIQGYTGVVGTNGVPTVTITGVGLGTFSVTMANVGGTALAGVVDIGFTLVHAA